MRLAPEILIGKEQLAPDFPQLSLEVVGEQPQEDVRVHPVRQMMVDRADVQTEGFQRAEGPLDPR